MGLELFRYLFFGVISDSTKRPDKNQQLHQNPNRHRQTTNRRQKQQEITFQTSRCTSQTLGDSNYDDNLNIFVWKNTVCSFLKRPYIISPSLGLNITVFSWRSIYQQRNNYFKFTFLWFKQKHLKQVKKNKKNFFWRSIYPHPFWEGFKTAFPSRSIDLPRSQGLPAAAQECFQQAEAPLLRSRDLEQRRFLPPRIFARNVLVLECF